MAATVCATLAVVDAQALAPTTAAAPVMNRNAFNAIGQSSEPMPTVMRSNPAKAAMAAAPGHPVGATLRRHDGNLVITQPGTVIDLMDINGFVTIKAPNVTIKRSIIRGGPSTGSIGLIMNYMPSATNTRVMDTTLAPRIPSPWIDGLKGMNIHAERVNIYNTSDGAGFHGDNNSIVDSYISNLRFFAKGSVPGLTRDTHNDGIQIHGGKNNYFARNNITGGHNAAIQVTQDVARTANLVIENNFLNHGGCSVNIHDKGKGQMYGVVVRNNRFGRATRVSDCAVIATAASNVETNGNVWADNKQPVRIRKG